jgi:GNAT superfamily N-acetyltransferase
VVELAGFAAYTMLWPSYGSTRSLFLKELYVLAGFHRRGVADSLMGRLTRVANDLDCYRIEWTTDETNKTAQDFYASRGSKPYSGKLTYRLTLRNHGLLTTVVILRLSQRFPS